MIHKLLRLGKTAALAALLYYAATLSPAHAALIAYEGFDYEPGALGGKGDATGGWGNSWQANTASTVVEGGLTYTDANGQHLVVSGNRGLSTAVNGSAEPNRNLDMARNQDGDTTWISFIAQRLAPHGTDEQNLLRAANLQLRLGNGNERLAVGKNTTNSIEDPLGNWSLYNGTNAGHTGTPHLEQAFLVVRIDHHAGADNDEAWLWVNPLLATEPSTDDAVKFPIDREFSFDQVRIFAGGHQNAGATTPERPYADFTYDEIRLGTTYSAVTPFVPEPASMSLLGLAYAGGTLVRFRRK